MFDVGYRGLKEISHQFLGEPDRFILKPYFELCGSIFGLDI